MHLGICLALLVARVHNRDSQIPLSRLIFFSIPPHFMPESQSPSYFFTKFFA